MRYVLIVGVILLSASSLFSQNRDLGRLGTPQAESKSRIPDDCLSGARVEGCRFAMPLPSLDEFLNSGDRLVFVDGALRTKGLAGLYATPGGGASGCFSAAIQKRVDQLREFTPNLGDFPKPAEDPDYWRFRAQRVGGHQWPPFSDIHLFPPQRFVCFRKLCDA